MADPIITTTRTRSHVPWLAVAGVIVLPIVVFGIVDQFVRLPSWLATTTLTLAPILAVAFAVRHTLRHRAMCEQLRKTGQWTTATVRSVKQQSSPVRGEFRLYLDLEVQADQGTFRALHEEVVEALHLSRLQEGCEVPVVYDRQDERRLILRL